jgi:hypothetical protein
MALSIGFGNSVSLLFAIQATRLLTFASVGLSPTEHPSLSWTRFRTAGFPGYGWKAGLSGGACPSTTSSSGRAVCLHPSWTSLPVSPYPRSESRGAVRKSTTIQAALPPYPRGPRSGPSYVVSVHHHLIDPMRPTRQHTLISPIRLIRDALAVRAKKTLRRLSDQRVVPCFHRLLFISMSSFSTPGSPSSACTQFLRRRP